MNFTFETRYSLQCGPDGVTWASLDPLLEDLKELAAQPEFADNEEVRKNIAVVRLFVESLLQESRIQQWARAKHNGEDDDESSYSDTLH